MEDPIAHKLESKAWATPSPREAVGRWIFENVVQAKDDKWLRKIASITH